MNWNNLWIRNDGRKYDSAKVRNAGQRTVIYYLVALYVGYLGYSIISNRLAGDDTMSYPVAIIFSSVLIIGAIFVAFSATKRMRNELKQEETLPDEKEENNE